MGKISEQTFFNKNHTHGQHVHDKVFNMANHQGNANQIHNEISLYICHSEVKLIQSCPTLCDPMYYTGYGNLQARILEWVTFSFRGSPNPGLEPRSPTLQADFLHLSHKGSPWILEWVAYSFSRGSSCPRDPTGVSCIAGGFFTNWAMREAHTCHKYYTKITRIVLVKMWRKGK